MNVLLLILLHIAAALGAYLLLRLRAPAASLVGAMFGVVAFFFVSGLEVAYPPALRLTAQILSGLIIGMRFSAEDVATLKKMVGPVALLVVLVITVNLGFSFFMFEATHFNFMTALFTTGLGGVSDLALIAPEFGADMEAVALLQLARLVTVVIVFPPLIKATLHVSAAKETMEKKAKTKEGRTFYWSPNFLLTLLAAAVGGLLFNYVRVPAGGILGSIVTTALWNILTPWGAMPPSMKEVAQTAAGAYIGSNLTIATILGIKVLFIPYLIMVAEIFVMAYIGAWLFTRIFKFDWPTALFCAAPGGIQVMGLIGADLGLDPPKIVLMHTVRILATLTTLPVIAHLLS
jgi:membrane AbrB-like protein